MVKAVNSLKILSLLVLLVTLLFVYAFLPVMVNLNPDVSGWSLHKEYFFYVVVGASLILNIFLIFAERTLSSIISSEEINAWIKGFSFVLNLYFSFLIGYVAVINNQNHFQSGSYAYLNYLGPILVLVWIIGLIFLSLKRNKTT
ncbi:MAG: hypothetical protein JXR03_13305 [Cyclobacteriaceae bacterium]